jgi:hypothetical protein
MFTLAYGCSPSEWYDKGLTPEQAGIARHAPTQIVSDSEDLGYPGAPHSTHAMENAEHAIRIIASSTWDDELAAFTNATRDGFWKDDGAPVGKQHRFAYLDAHWALKFRGGEKHIEVRPNIGVCALKRHRTRPSPI